MLPSGATVVNTLSIAAFVHTPLRAPYSAAKAAAAAYFRCLQLDHPDAAIVNVFPGSVATHIAHNALTASGARFSHADPNIDAGLHPDRVADRMLAAVSCGVVIPSLRCRRKCSPSAWRATSRRC